MNIIYLDTLFLVNFVCDYILLLCTAKVSGVEIRRIHITTAALLGGIYACFCAISPYPWLGHPLIKATSCILLCLISFGTEHHLLRCTVIFLCISALAGGLLSAISIPYGNISYIPVQLKTVVLMFGLMYFIMHTFFRRLPQQTHREYNTITIKLNERTVSIRALQDSGNELFDPITNRPVLICEPKILQQLFDIPLNSSADPYTLFCMLNTAEGSINRMRLISCQTVTGKGLLVAFRPDEITINGKQEPYLVALSPTAFSPNASYQAIY